MLDDVTGLQQLDLQMYPVILTSSSRQHYRLSVKGKNVSTYCDEMNTLEGFQTYPHRTLVV